MQTTPTQLKSKTISATQELLSVAIGKKAQIILTAEAQHTILCDVAESAELNLIRLITDASAPGETLSATVQENGVLNMWEIIFRQNATIETTIHLHGVRARIHHRSIIFGTGTTNITLLPTAIHHAPETSSKLDAKIIVKDSAHVRYNGMVDMRNNARGSEGHLEQRALILSDTAKVSAIPGLEIGTNDVRASHAASMTRIDQDQLFYAASRGITTESAVYMIAEGFLKPLIHTIPDQKLQKMLIKKIAELL